MAANNFNEMSGYQSAYGTEHMIDLVPSMFGRVYTVPPKEAYLDMAEHALPYGTAMKNWEDFMEDEMAQFYPAEDTVMTADEVESMDKDALQKAIYQVHLESQGNPDVLMTPDGPALDPNSLDAMSREYNLVSELDPMTINEDIAMVDEVMENSGESLGNLADAISARIEQEGYPVDNDLMLATAGDQIAAGLTGAGTMDLSDFSMDIVNDSISGIADSMTSLFNRGMDFESDEMKEFYPKDVTYPRKVNEPFVNGELVNLIGEGKITASDILEGRNSGRRTMNETPIPYPTDISQVSMDFTGQDLFVPDAPDGYDEAGRPFYYDSEGQLQQWNNPNPNLNIKPVSSNQNLSYPFPMGANPYVQPQVTWALKKLEAEKALIQSEAGSLNTLLDSEYTVEEILNELNELMRQGAIDESDISLWITQDNFVSLVDDANLNSSLLIQVINDEILTEYSWKTQSKDDKKDVDFILGARGMVSRGNLKTDDPKTIEEKLKAVDGDKALAQKIEDLMNEQSWVTWEQARYMIENKMSWWYPSKDFSRKSFILNSFKQGHSPMSAEQYYNSLPEDVMNLMSRNDLIQEMIDLEYLNPRTWTEDTGIDQKIKELSSAYKKYDTAMSQKTGVTEAHREKLIEQEQYEKGTYEINPKTGKPVIDPKTGKPIRVDIITDSKIHDTTITDIRKQAVIEEAQKEQVYSIAADNMKASFYNMSYAEPGTGRPEVHRLLPERFQRVKTLFFLSDLGHDYVRGLLEAKQITTVDDQKESLKELNTMFESFYSRYRTNEEFYNSGEWLNERIDWVAHILRKMESEPAKLTAPEGTWTPEEIASSIMIENTFSGDSNFYNRRTLIALKVTGGRQGNFFNRVANSTMSLMDHYRTLGKSESWIFDTMMSIFQEPSQVAPQVEKTIPGASKLMDTPPGVDPHDLFDTDDSAKDALTEALASTATLGPTGQQTVPAPGLRNVQEELSLQRMQDEADAQAIINEATGQLGDSNLDIDTKILGTGNILEPKYTSGEFIT